MTPKEKADDLIHNIQWNTLISSKKAKNCALIVVNEILNLKRNDITKGMFISVTITDEIYWNEVKEEIEKL